MLIEELNSHFAKPVLSAGGMLSCGNLPTKFETRTKNNNALGGFVKPLII